MKKRRIACIVAGLSALAIGGALLGCGSRGTRRRGASLDDVKITVTGETTNGEGMTTLTWDAVPGYTFSIYRADDEYSDYLLYEDDNTTGVFTDTGRCAYYKVVAHDGNGNEVKTFGGNSQTGDLISEQAQFGRNVFIFSPDTPAATVNAKIGDRTGGLYSQMFDEVIAEFSDKRFAVMFKEGEYDDTIALKSGYYTTFHGLGQSPEDVSIRSLTCKNGTNGNGCINFWRGAENFTVRTDSVWAVSQGVSLRAMNYLGGLTLNDFGAYVSGGFISDSKIAGTVAPGSQQQWLSRNCTWNNWTGGVWNMCFAGIDGTIDGSDASYPTKPYTVRENTNVKEKPYLVFDEENGYRIAVPAARENANGISWSAANAASRIERYIAMDDIYFASPSESVATINAAIAAGKAVVMTPGIYNVSSPIEVKRDDAVILGIGIATLRPTGGNLALLVEDCKDVAISGLLVDAGKTENDCLVSIGTEDSQTSDVNLYDMFIRIGGVDTDKTYAETAMKIYADDCFGDNFWIWRADHDLGTGWGDANATTGLKVYGDNFSAYALMVEHFKGHNVEWYGNGGDVFFYQCEIAYDVPSQSHWMDGSKKGFSSIFVDDGVDTFIAQGVGVYANFHVDGIELDSAIIVPDKPGVNIRHACIVRLNNKGSINHIVNEIGDAVPSGSITRQTLTSLHS